METLKNMGKADRLLRAVVGVVLVLISLLGSLSPGWMWVLLVIGVVLLVTAAVGVCPAYFPFRITTLGKRT